MTVVILVTSFAAEGFLTSGGDGSLIFSKWLEIGKVTVGSDAFVKASGKIPTFINPQVFISLPDQGNAALNSGYSSCFRLNEITNTSLHPGAVSFQVRVTQPNDSWCNYTWWTPVIEPAQRVFFMIIETGHWNLSGAELDAKDEHWNQHCVGQTHRHIYYSSFENDVVPGFIAQTQTYVDYRYLSIRDERVAVLAYKTDTFQQTCKDGFALESHLIPGMTSDSRYIPFIHLYLDPPAVFGIVDTSYGGDEVTVRSFNHSING
eukprot:gene4244-5367_t